jgi:hypothetical protein
MSRVNANVPKYEGQIFMNGLYRFRCTQFRAASEKVGFISGECIDVGKKSVGSDDPDLVLGRTINDQFIALDPSAYPDKQAHHERILQNLCACVNVDPNDFDTEEVVDKEFWAYVRAGRNQYGVMSDSFNTFKDGCFVPDELLKNA